MNKQAKHQPNHSNSVFRNFPRLTAILALLVLTVIVLSGLKWLNHSKAQQASPKELATQTTTHNKPQLAKPTNQLAEQTKLTQHEITITKGQSLASIFQQLNIPPAQLLAIDKLGKQATALRKLQPGQVLHIALNNQHHIETLSTEISLTQKLVITRDDNGFNASIEALPLEQKLNYVYGSITSSLSKAAKKAGLTSQQTYELSQIFKTKVDFRKLRAGDHFNALYESFYSHGELVKKGVIVAAEFTHAGKTYAAIRFTYPKNHTGYYTPDGNSYKISISRAPLKYSRISSTFGKRYHPILHFTRPHEGIDYAAPNGTAIHAAGAGVITYIGNKGGYGRVIFIKHNSTYSTRYAHMKRFAKGLKRGSHVRKGQVIGYVGMSGLATGPHVHFEVRVNGKPKNPLKVALPGGQPIPKAYMTAFKTRSSQLLSTLAAQTEVSQQNV